MKLLSTTAIKKEPGEMTNIRNPAPKYHQQNIGSQEEVNYITEFERNEQYKKLCKLMQEKCKSIQRNNERLVYRYRLKLFIRLYF